LTVGVAFRVFILSLLTLTLVSCVTSSVPEKTLADEYYNLGNAWFDLKKYDQAARAYQAALGWNPSLKIAIINLARTKAEQGEPAEALTLLAPLVTSDPENLIVLQYQAWLTAKHLGLAAAADRYLALSLRLPGDAATQLNAGLCLDAADRTNEAFVVFSAWKALDGKTWVGLSAWARTLEKLSAAGVADAWFEAADSLPEGDARRFAPLTARARALEADRLFGDAVQTWNTALALPPASDQERGKALFQKGSLLLLEIEDYAMGSQSLIEAWKAGYQDAEAWKALRTNPRLRFSVKLEADLKLASVAQGATP
jgi:tetratricopeptide (TPR) repeat protein